MALHYYYYPTSHWSRVMALVIAEKGLEPERHLVDLRVNANFEPEYMKLNPRGVVPTLVDGDQAIWDSPRIAEHLDTVGGPKLVRREDPVHTRWMDRLEDFRLMHLSYSVWILGLKGERSAEILTDKIERAQSYADRYPDQAELYTRKRAFFEKFRAELLDEGYMERCYADCQQTLDALASDLEGRPWIGGEEYGFADAIATSILYRLVDLERLCSWKSDDEHPLTGYFARLCERPSFAAVFRDDPLITE